MRLRASRVLVALALLSLAANVFLLLERQPNHGEESVRHDGTPPQHTETQLSKESGTPARVQGCEQELSVARECQQEVARLRTELAEAAKRSGTATAEQQPDPGNATQSTRVLPTAEEFARNQPNPSLEQVLAPELQRTLSSDPRRSYTLQCRGTICRVELMTVPDDETWALELQQEGAFGKYIEAMSLKWAKPVYDPRSDKWFTRHEALFTARP